MIQRIFIWHGLRAQLRKIDPTRFGEELLQEAVVYKT